MLYREALARGLDRADLVVRRRLVQKMEMLALRDGPGISESDLMDHYLAHRADYAVGESVSFRHVFFSGTTRGADAYAAAGAALGGVRAGGAAGVGDPPPMPPEVSGWTWCMVEARFGRASPRGLEAGPDGWSGPVASAYGVHLVLVTGRAAARVPDFAEVAGRIATDRTRPAARGRWTAFTRPSATPIRSRSSLGPASPRFPPARSRREDPA